MDMFSSMNVSATGMTAEQVRMEAAAQNLAAVHAVRTPGEAMVAVHHVQVREAGALADADPAFAALMSGKTGSKGVEAEDLATPAAVRLQYEPGHPLADAKGYVAYPDINVLDEMMSIMGAQRAFDANVTAYTEARSMLQKSLEIGRA